MKILILLCLVAWVCADRSPDLLKECSLKGPKFWCTNKQTAEQCSALHYCTTYVWKNTAPSSKAKEATGSANIDTCETCQQVIGTVHMMLENNATQSQVIAVLEGMCKVLPEMARIMCDEMISLESAKIIKFLRDYTQDPRVLCKELHLCSADVRGGIAGAEYGSVVREVFHDDDHQLPGDMPSNNANDYIKFTPDVPEDDKVKVVAPSNDMCALCQQVIGTARLIISRKESQAQIMEALSQICHYFPAAEQAYCTAAVENYGPTLIKMLLDHTQDPRPICRMLGLCGSSSPMVEVKPNSANGVVCDTCMDSVGIIYKTLLTYNTTIVGFLKTGCMDLPVQVRAACEAYVPELFEEVLNFLKNPVNLCKEFDLCSGRKSMMKEVAPMKEAKKANGITCEICELLMQKLDNMLKGNKTKEAVEHALDKLCDDIPWSMQCKKLVHKYSDQIVNILVTELKDADRACRELGLCLSQAASAPKSVKKADGITCEICDLLMEKLDNMLKGNKTKEAVEHALDKLCDDIPWSMQCKKLVHKYTDQIVDMMVMEMDPDKMCRQLGLCDTATASAPKSVKKADGITCEICDLLMEKLDNMLKGNKTKEAVEHALDKLCDDIPWSMQCKKLVHKYTDQIVDMMVMEMDPDKMCRQLGLCDTATVKAIKATPKSNGITCEVCELLMQKLDTMLKEKKTKEAVKDALNKLCDEIPWSMQCTDLVDKYTDQIVDMLATELKNTDKVCRALGVCLSGAALTGKNGFIGCEVCVVGVELVISSSKGKIKHFLDSLCDLTLNETRINECRNMVKNLTAMIATGVHGETVCKYAGYCDASAQVNVLQPVQELPTCNLCSFMSGKLDASLKSSSSKKTIKAGLKSVCMRTKLSHDEMEGCHRMMSENRHMIVKLTKKMKLQKMCKSIGHCKVGLPSSSSVFFRQGFLLQKSATKGYRQTGRCTVCQYVMGILDDALGGHSTKKKIITKVHSLCNMLPRPIFVTECNAIIGEYGGELIDLLIANYLQPKDFCEHIGLC